jgi:hypothetical protein
MEMKSAGQVQDEYRGKMEERGRIGGWSGMLGEVEGVSGGRDGRVVGGGWWGREVVK